MEVAKKDLIEATIVEAIYLSLMACSQNPFNWNENNYHSGDIANQIINAQIKPSGVIKLFNRAIQLQRIERAESRPPVSSRIILKVLQVLLEEVERKQN